MRLGVIARANGRGLAVQTAAVARHFDASVLLVDVPNHSSRRFPTDTSAFPGAQVVTVGAGWTLPEHDVRSWLTGLTHAYSAETLYDERLADWARSMDVATAVHANPEFVPPGGGWGIGRPSAWWSATSWRLDTLPDGAKVIPMPVDLEPYVEPHDGPCRFTHVAGKATTGDRNGTISLLAALPLLRRPCSVRIVTQEPALPAHVDAPAHVQVEVVTGGVESTDDLYVDSDVLVMPRRYGGLCLPVGEAMARGLAVLMTDMAPNPQTWPVATVAPHRGPTIDVPCGRLRIAEVDPARLAAAMDKLADPPVRQTWQSAARGWAKRNSWAELGPLWRRELERMEP